MKKLLYFTSTRCGPCKVFGPVINELSQKYDIQKIDIDQNKTMTSKYNVRAVPTSILVDESGNEIKRLTGIQSKQTIINLFN